MTLLLFLIALPVSASLAAELSVVGLDGGEVRITADQWAALPRESLDVIDHSGSPARFEGVPGREILKLVDAPLGKELRGGNLAVFVVAEAADGYRVVYSLAEFDSGFRDATILVADKKDGKALGAGGRPVAHRRPGRETPGPLDAATDGAEAGQSPIAAVRGQVFTRPR